MIKPLSELAPNTKAKIHSIVNEQLEVKLMEMGFIPGEGILLEIIAPLGDPISMMVGGCNWSIRKEQAERILVEVVDSE